MKLKILCLNTWIGGVLFEPMVTYLQKEQADIYLLQEVFNGTTKSPESLSLQYKTFTELKHRLNLPYGHFAPAFDELIDGTKIAQGNAILSQYPLTEISTTYYDVPFGVRDNRQEVFYLSPRNLQHVVVSVNSFISTSSQITNNSVTINHPKIVSNLATSDNSKAANTSKALHLLNTQGIWSEDGGDSPRRLQMANHILAEVSNSSPLILAGDFNVQPQTKTIELIEQKLHNVFKNELNTTFNLKRKDLVKYPGYASAVVDMFFVTPDIKVLVHSCPAIDVSDHLPLVVELEV